MSDPDFEEQLRQEQLEKAKAEGVDGTYTDADGTVFEWDAQKKAYFPKIDDDFIARYQMNYGQGTSQETSKEETPEADTRTEEEKKRDYEQYCKDYYNYYYGHYPHGDNGETHEDGQSETGGDNSTTGDNPEGQYTYDEYLEYYQYYYGQNSTAGQEVEGSKEEKKAEEVKDTKKKTAEDEKQKAEKKPKADTGWFDHDSEKSTHVYVSGLPLDITDEEFRELMNKYGLIMYDPFTHKPKLKLYRDENGQPKGDGLCCFIKQESVELALNLLDGSDVRGHKISVERAQFQMKGAYNPSKKRKKLSNKDKRKIKEKQAKLFDWRPEKEEGRLKCERTVVLKNMFDPKEFEENPTVINELRVDVRAEAAKFGDVKKVTVYDRHPDGVITVRYKEAEEADMCVSNLHGRWFAKRRIIAQTWDGRTKYEVEETEEEREARIRKWETFLEKGDANAASATASSVAGASSQPAVTSEPPVASSHPGTTSPNPVTSVPVETSAPSVPADESSTLIQSNSLSVDSEAGDKTSPGENTPTEVDASKENSS